MVGPSLTDDEQSVANARLKALFVLLVSGSMTVVALQTDPTPEQLAVVVVASLLVGVALLWYLLRILGEMEVANRRRFR
ncbi:hypothetical protein ACNS7O_00890 [Haloferacaceae archaeon DSL9]